MTWLFEITGPQTGMYGRLGFFDSPRPCVMIVVSRMPPDAAKATFHFGVPTVTETVVEIVEINGKPTRITEKLTVGKVMPGLALNLFLKFLVVNPQGPLTVSVGSFMATAAPGQTSVTIVRVVAGPP